MPARSKGTSLRLTVSNHSQSDEIWVIKDRSESVRDRVTQLTTLVQATRCFGCGMRSNSTGERERFEKAPHTLLIFALVRVDLGVDSLEETV